MKTDVAVGIVFRRDGAVLIGQRLPGKPYAGWWEFPGGKFEAGESAAQALARELDEELGVHVLQSLPWVVREHVYEHAHVRLHFRRVVRWDGEVTSREGQAFVWRQPAAIDVEPLLPAAIAPIAWLGLPAEYAISDAAARGVDDFLVRLAARLQDGERPLKLLQLREPAMTGAAFAALFETVVAMASDAGARVLVNSRHPERYWVLAGERTGGGVHLTSHDLEEAARGVKGPPAFPLLAASCHSSADLKLAGQLGADLAVLGPVNPTASHPGASVLGWAGFERAIALTPVPVFALGGLHAGDIDRARHCGAQGIAVQRAAWLD